MTQHSLSCHLESEKPTLSIDEIFSVIPDLIFVVDDNFIITEYRAGNSSDLYLPPDKFLQQSMCHVLPNEPANAIKQTVILAKQSGNVEHVEYQLTVNNVDKWFEARVSQSMVGRIIILVRDITQRKTDELKVNFQANHDHLTGLYNRSFTFDYLNQKIKECVRQQSTLSVLFIDIDDFKKVNDCFGHQIGDCVLISVANALRVSVREQDAVCRIGGDEFVIIMHDVISDNKLAVIAEQIDKGLTELSINLDQPLSISVSIGASESKHGKVGGSELLRRADVAMFYTKNHGKHGFSNYNAEMESGELSK